MRKPPADARQSIRFPSLWVTPQGRVYRARRNGIRRVKPRYVRRYAAVQAYEAGETCQTYVHLLVAEAFLGPKPTPQHICRHIGKRRDNSVGNLCWDTFSNALKPPKGEQHYFAKLSEPEVVDIIDLLATGSFMKKTIAANFNVSPETISAIAANRIWKHVPRPARLAA